MKFFDCGIMMVPNTKESLLSVRGGLREGAYALGTSKVQTNIRRAKLYVTSQKGFVIDDNVYKIFYEGHDLELTLKEFKLLKMLIARAGTTIEREELFREVWGESCMGETLTLDIHISQLRDK